MQFFKHSVQVLPALTGFILVYLFLPILPDSQMLSAVDGCLGCTKLSACMATFQLFANVVCESISLILERVFSVSCRTWSEFSLSSHCTSATFARTGRSADMWCLTTALSSVCRWGGLGRGQCYCRTLNSSSQHRAAVLRAREHLLPVSGLLGFLLCTNDLWRAL